MSVIQNIEVKSRKGKLIMYFLYAALAIGAFIQFLPLLWLFIGTFKTNSELINPIPTLFPETWSLESYKEAFGRYDMGSNLYNTVFFCVAIIVIQTFTSTLAAFALSKIKPKVSNVIYMLFLGTQMFNGTALMFPLYIMMTKMGLIGSRWSWILSSSAWAYAIVLYKNFFDSIPTDMFEAAQIDGAGTFKQIVSIILPMSKPVYTVCILNTFMSVYNDFLLPIMLLPDEETWTLMMRIYNTSESGSIKDNIKYVLLFVTCIPSIIIYLFAQKNIQEGISTAGIKG